MTETGRPHCYVITYYAFRNGDYTGTRVRSVEAWTAADALTMFALEVPTAKPMKIAIPPAGSGAPGIDYSEREWLEEVDA